jgi:hypothetical protein
MNGGGRAHPVEAASPQQSSPDHRRLNQGIDRAGGLDPRGGAGWPEGPTRALWRRPRTTTPFKFPLNGPGREFRAPPEGLFRPGGGASDRPRGALRPGRAPSTPSRPSRSHARGFETRASALSADAPRRQGGLTWI